MDNVENGITSEEETQNVLRLIYDDASTYENINRKYGISRLAISELKNMSKIEFEKFINSIKYVEGELKEGKSVRKIAARMGCGSAILSFVVKEAIDGIGTVNSKEAEYAIQRKKVEKLWKQYKQGEDVKKLALKHNMDGENLKELIDSFDRSLASKRRAYMPKKSEEKKAKARELKEKYNFDADTIAYLLYGKEFENLKQKEGVSLDEP